MELQSEFDSGILTRLRTLQMIAFSLIMGVVVFAAVVWMMLGQQNAAAPSPTQPPLSLDLMRMIAGGLLLGAIAGAAVITIALPQQCRKSLAAIMDTTNRAEVHAQVFSRFFVSRIMAMALFEGAAIFGIVTVLINGQLVDFGFAAAGVVAMIAQFPTAGKWRGFLASCTDERPGRLEKF